MISRKLIANSLWLIFDKSFILLGGLVTTLIVARYLSPQEMGLINYSIMISGFCTVVSQWGAKFTLFDTATRDVHKANLFLGFTIIPRIILYFLLWSFFSFYLYNSEKFEDFIFISAFSLSMIFLAIDVYQYLFDGQLKSKFNTYATFLGRLFSIVSRLIIVYLDLGLWYFLIPAILEGILVFGVKLVLHSRGVNRNKINVDSNESFYSVNIEYFKSGLPIVIFSFISLFYDRVNILLIKEYMTFSDVAIFSMAKTLAMSWTFLPMSFSTSIITKELNKLNGIYLAQSYRTIFLVSIIPLLVAFFFPDHVILYSLGTDYVESASYLFWLCLLAMFSCVNITTNRVIASFGLRGKKFLIKKSIILSIVSICGGLIFISEFGIIGALFNASIIMMVELFLLNFIFNRKYFCNVYFLTFKICK